MPVRLLLQRTHLRVDLRQGVSPFWLRQRSHFKFMDQTSPPPVPQEKTSQLAVWSLTLGILSLTCCSIISAVPGVICGHTAINRINSSNGGLGGKGLAIAGLITGYLGIA